MPTGAAGCDRDFAEVCAEHPSKFKAFAYLPLQSPDAAAAELRRIVEELGLVGAILGTHLNGKAWDDLSLFPVLEAASDPSVPVFIHPVRPCVFFLIVEWDSVEAHLKWRDAESEGRVWFKDNVRPFMSGQNVTGHFLQFAESVTAKSGGGSDE